MDKTGQVWGYALMIGIVVIILALALAPAGNDFITSSMNASVGNTIGLDCDNSSISNFDKGACVVTDFSLFYFFGGLLLIGIAVMSAKIMMGGG